MANHQSPAMYLIDTDVFVQAKNLHYRFEFCGGFWQWLQAAHTANLVFRVKKVRAELMAGKKDDLARIWVEQLPDSFFLEDASDAQVMACYAELMTWAASRKPTFLPAAINEFADSKKADAFLVAAARCYGGVVVTHERSQAEATRQVLVPNAAIAVGVKPMTIFELLLVHAESTFNFKP